jgi:hypothetical protein
MGRAWEAVMRTARKRCQSRRMMARRGAELLQDSDRKPNDFNRGLRSNTWGLRGGSVRDKGNRVELVITRAGYGCKLTGKLRGKEVLDTEHLRSQHAIDGDKTELAFAMEEVGNV